MGKNFNKETENSQAGKVFFKRGIRADRHMGGLSKSCTFGKFRSFIRGQSSGSLFSSGQLSCFDPVPGLSQGPPYVHAHPLAKMDFNLRVSGKLAKLIMVWCPLS